MRLIGLNIGSHYRKVLVTRSDLERFAAGWPCFGQLRDSGILFEFDMHDGDLIDVTGDSCKYDRTAMIALSEDAKAFAFDGVNPEWL